MYRKMVKEIDDKLSFFTVKSLGIKHLMGKFSCLMKRILWHWKIFFNTSGLWAKMTSKFLFHPWNSFFFFMYETWENATENAERKRS